MCSVVRVRRRAALVLLHRRDVALGMQGANGVVLITTKRGRS